MLRAFAFEYLFINCATPHKVYLSSENEQTLKNFWIKKTINIFAIMILLHFVSQPVPISKANSVLSQSLIQVTFCAEFDWFRARSVIDCDLSSVSEECWIFSLNFTLFQRSSEIISQLVLKSFWIITETWKFSEIVLNQFWLSLIVRCGTYKKNTLVWYQKFAMTIFS